MGIGGRGDTGIGAPGENFRLSASPRHPIILAPSSDSASEQLEDNEDQHGQAEAAGQEVSDQRPADCRKHQGCKNDHGPVLRVSKGDDQDDLRSWLKV